jgi:hypothetical protein
VIYLDSSAVLKLMTAEAESDVLEDWSVEAGTCPSCRAR